MKIIEEKYFTKTGKIAQTGCLGLLTITRKSGHYSPCGLLHCCSFAMDGGIKPKNVHE